MASDLGGGIEVLYIEDSRSYAKLVEFVLASRPRIRLQVAEDGLTGLDLARRRPPALILLDRHLPDIDGDEVLARLRAEPETVDVPVVMVTADDAPEDIQRLLSSGASAWLVKPFQPATLLELIDGGVWLAASVSSNGSSAATAGAEDGACLDETVLANLRRLVAASPGVDLPGLLAAFGREGRSRMDQLRGAIAAGDARAIADVARGLIGSSSRFGALRVTRASRHLQRLAVAGDLAGAATMLDRLESEFAETDAAMAQVDP